MTKFIETTTEKIQEKLDNLGSSFKKHNIEFKDNKPFKSEQLTLALAKLIELEDVLFGRRLENGGS